MQISKLSLLEAQDTRGSKDMITQLMDAQLFMPGLTITMEREN